VQNHANCCVVLDFCTQTCIYTGAWWHHGG